MEKLTSRRANSVILIVGFLAFVEFTSGVIQGYYTPLLTSIARFLGVHDADMNWLEGTQLMLSAISVPIFAKLSDTFGQKKILLISSGITAVAALTLPFAHNFGVYLAGWTMMGCYVAWLPIEIALVWARSSGSDKPAAMTRLASGVLVAALEIGAIAGTLIAGALSDAGWGISQLLWIPAVVIAVCFFVILLGVRDSQQPHGGRFDIWGAVLITVALLGLTGGLSLLRLLGVDNAFSWIAVVVGLALLIPFCLYELRQSDPLIDVRLFKSPSLWPVFATSGLFGVSVLGAQTPLSTYARTDPSEVGYGLGMSSGQTSYIIGAYVLCLVVGALLFPVVTRWVRPRITLIGASLLIGVGYLLFLPFHASLSEVITNMVVAGLGSGALVAALPSASAAAAPSDQTGVATGLTNAIKTVGGAIASCVFGVALMHAVAPSGAGSSTAGSFTGYVTVWILCGVTAVVAAILLCFVPASAFADKK
jgi:predicted MFS family arabinose efflux permease